MPGANSQGSDAIHRPVAAESVRGRVALVELMLDAALVALRNGMLDELIRQRPRAARYLTRRFVGLARGTAGDAIEMASAEQRLPNVLLRWLITQLRPDDEPSFERIPTEAWLNLTSWRPMLAVACHAGVIPVPDFRERYRRRVDEAIVDNLCGLWNVGPSTFYRYQERGKRTMALVVVQSLLPAVRRLSLRRFVLREFLEPALLEDEHQRRLWHCAQASRTVALRDPAAGLWHAWHGNEMTVFVETLRTHATALANDPETDALVVRAAAGLLSTRQQFDLWIGRAVLARTRNAPERELAAYDSALQIGYAKSDRLLQGIAYGALGKFHEARDADRAFACYQDSAEFLRDVHPGGDAVVVEHYLTTLVRLAWLYLLRNDDRSKAVLDRAEALRAATRPPEDVLGMLEQSWGEYWGRSGGLQQSLEHRQRALNIFERIGDERSVLTTSLNLIQVYAELKQFDRAIEYSNRVLRVAATGVVEPAIVVSTHLNLGATYFLQGAFGAAIGHYEIALHRSLSAGLRLHAFRARYNLAEAHYRRFRERAQAHDEVAGDAYVEQAVASPTSEGSPAALESARRLKGDVLGTGIEPAPDRLQPSERTVYSSEMEQIQRWREVLSIPSAPEVHVEAHLAIATAYLQMSVTERDVARQLIERHQMHARFASELDRLRETFDRTLTGEERVRSHWLASCADLMDDTRVMGIVARMVRDGSINKSGYADLCGVSPATASKHLAMLTERGLLQQTGKGPSTRYRLLD